MIDFESDLLTEGRSDREILIDVYTLLADSARWCQEAVALTSEGLVVKAADVTAAAWSIEGALGVCSNEFGIAPPHLLEYLDQKVLEFTGYPGEPSIWNEYDLGWFNDYVTHDAVMEFLGGVLRETEDQRELR